MLCSDIVIDGHDIPAVKGVWNEAKPVIALGVDNRWILLTLNPSYIFNLLKMFQMIYRVYRLCGIALI